MRSPLHQPLGIEPWGFLHWRSPSDLAHYHRHTPQPALSNLDGLFRFRLATSATGSDRSRLPHATGETAVSPAVLVELERLRLQLEFKAAELALAQQRIEELKQRERDGAAERDRLLALLEQSTRLLAAPPAAAPPAPAVAPVPKIKSKKAAKKT